MRIRKALKNSQTVRATIPYSSSKEVGILFTVEDGVKHQLIKSFINRLQNDGKHVQVLEYLPRKKENPEFMFDFFTIDDLNFWGKVNAPAAEKFSKIQFDYLFVVDTQTNPLINYLLANSLAHCRVGKYDEKSASFMDLMIETNGSVQGLIDNMYEYTKKLR